MDKDHVSAFASGEPNTAYPQYFTGQSYLKMLTKGKIPVFPEMSLRLRLRSSTGTVLRRIPGSRTLPLKCRLKALRMNGAKK